MPNHDTPLLASAVKPRRTFLMVAAAIALLVATCAGGIYLLGREHRAALEAVTTLQSNLALGLEREILRNLDIYDLSLRSAASGLPLVDTNMEAEARRAVLFDGSTAAQYFRPIIIADPSGTVVYDGAARIPRIAVIGNRALLDAHRENPDLGLLVRLTMRSGIDGKPFLAVARRIRGPGGSFGGVVAGGLDLSYFRDIFSRFDLPDGASISLTGFDGRLVAGFPPNTDVVGQTATDPGLAERARQDGLATFNTSGGSGSGSRITTVRRLGSLPFFLAISVPRKAVFAQWRVLAWGVGSGMFVFADICLLLLLALSRELVRRRAAEKEAMVSRTAVEASERRLGTYIDHLADGIIAIAVCPDGQLRYERINQAAERMLGLGGEAAGHPLHQAAPGPAVAVLEEKCRDCRSTEAAVRFDLAVEGDEGPRTLRTVLAPVCGGDGVTLILASVRDVTDTMKLEAQLRQAQRMEAVGQLTAGLAHDFNNLLQTQSGALELLIEDVQDTPRALEYATMALAASERGGCLTQSLLSFSGQQCLEPQVVPMGALLDGLRQMLVPALGPRIELRTPPPTEGDGPFVDRAHLETAILNLCFNARDAMAEGGVLTITARSGSPADAAETGMAAKEAIVLSVCDTGSGMAPEVFARACEPFFTTKAVGKGSGLGLSMVQGFVQQSGGAIRMQSEPGRGTCVELWLPRAVGAVGGPPGPRLVRSGLTGCNRRVLLVDDAPDLLAVMASLLESYGYEVVQAANGEEAVGLLETERRFDVLITDYMMPGIDGGVVAQNAGLRHPGLPILVLTGYAEADELTCLPPEIEVIQKPVRADVLAERVSRAMARAAAAPPGSGPTPPSAKPAGQGQSGQLGQPKAGPTETRSSEPVPSDAST